MSEIHLNTFWRYLLVSNGQCVWYSTSDDMSTYIERNLRNLHAVLRIISCRFEALRAVCLRSFHHFKFCCVYVNCEKSHFEMLSLAICLPISYAFWWCAHVRCLYMYVSHVLTPSFEDNWLQFQQHKNERKTDFTIQAIMSCCDAFSLETKTLSKYCLVELTSDCSPMKVADVIVYHRIVHYSWCIQFKWSAV